MSLSLSLEQALALKVLLENPKTGDTLHLVHSNSPLFLPTCYYGGV